MYTYISNNDNKRKRDHEFEMGWDGMNEEGLDGKKEKEMSYRPMSARP